MALTINNLLEKMAADFGLPDLSVSASPVSSVQGLRYVNIARIDVVRHLCPRRIKGQEFSSGRLGKLSRLRETEDESNACAAGADPHQIPLPAGEGTPIHYFNLAVQTDGGSFYPARERNYQYCYSHRTGQSYAATAERPLYAWGDGNVFVVPNGTQGQNQVVRYHFIELPPDVAIDGNWDIDEDLTDPVIDLALAISWNHEDGEKADAQIIKHLTRYIETCEFMTGDFSDLPAD